MCLHFKKIWFLIMFMIFVRYLFWYWRWISLGIDFAPQIHLPFGTLMDSKIDLSFQRRRIGGVPETTFSEHFVFLFGGSPFGALRFHFGRAGFNFARFGVNFSSCGLPLGVLLPPCWSIWLPSDALIQFCTQRPQKHVLFICFDSLRLGLCLNGLQQNLVSV